MKNFFLFLFSLVLLASCTSETNPNYAKLSGKIENNKDSILSIFNRQGLLKSIQIQEDGSFQDTIKIANPGIFTISTSLENRAPVFLKNGLDIKITANANNFLKELIFSGNGGENSNFILSQIEFGNTIGDPEKLFALEAQDFNNRIEALKTSYDSIFNKYNDLDSILIADVRNQNSQVLTYLENQYQKYQTMGPGKPSPVFEDYIDVKGGTKSLSDFKGKYVYIDVWATWCGPCVVEFPYLKTLKKNFKDKNIAFVGISTDESRRNGGSWEAAEQKWRAFIKKHELGDVQLWSGKDFSFQQAYDIATIPRFILVDPNGNIVTPDAPRPSDPRLVEYLKSLGI